MITDTHCHVYWKSFDEDRAAMLARARAAGVECLIVVGTDLETSRAARELARSTTGIHWTAGIHPHDADGASDDARAAIEELCREADCVAVGETGLDWFKEYSGRAAQLANFRWQLELARTLDKPVVIHCRDAHDDTAACVRAMSGVRGVMHCYSMGAEELGPYLDAGLHISFSGVVTYPKNERNREAARVVPLERLLFETDAPYLAPQSRRGRRNEPAFVRETLESVARLRGIEVPELERISSANAARLFGLPQPT